MAFDAMTDMASLRAMWLGGVGYGWLTMVIRLQAEQCRAWALHVSFWAKILHEIGLPPYHYGWVMEKR